MRLIIPFRFWIRQLSVRLLRHRGLVLRALLCWSIGCLILTTDEVNSYDNRLQMRGSQKVSNEIVLITLHPSDLNSAYGYRGQRFGPLQEIADITDSFYWDPALWSELLQKVLQQHPRKIGVSLFFSESLTLNNVTTQQLKILRDPKVVWASSTSLSERVNQPLLSTDLGSNVGLISLIRDEDGVVRRFVPVHTESLHLTEKITDQIVDARPNRFINFRGDGRSFTEYKARDILEDRISANAFSNKTIIIGAESPNATPLMTPLGPALRHEVFAQIADNLIEKRWISRFPKSVYILGLFALMVLAVTVILRYPQSVALVFILWIATLSSALSAWVFDVFYIWIPVVSPGIMLAATWVVFIGYQANKIEQENWQLHREQKYLSELEQLKNNFVSLISHDLKTPIAKIQAIVDRLISQDGSSRFVGDLKSLRLSSEELNSYIQSILKLLRVESRDFKLSKEVGDINEVIDEAIVQLRPLALEKQIQIESHLEPMFSIEVDFILIREVLVNLLDNAIKYTPVGGKVTVRSEETGNKVWIYVEDTGDGIAPNELANVWGKFVRGKDQDMKTKGTGLGLYLVKYFIELHGGEVFLDSELKKGTTVSFSLPLDPPDSPDEEPTTIEGAET